MATFKNGAYVTEWKEYIAYCPNCGWGTAGRLTFHSRREANAVASRHICRKQEAQ